MRHFFLLFVPFNIFLILHNVDILPSAYEKERKALWGKKKKPKNENMKDLYYQRKKDTFQFHLTHL